MDKIEEVYVNVGRGKIRLFMVCGALFVVLAVAALCYGVSRPQTAAIEASERHAIRQCRLSGNDLAASPASRNLQAQACSEMEKQFRNKFHREP